MESWALLALVIFLAIPIASLVALVRTGRLRKRLDEQHAEHLRDVSHLKQEIAALHGALTRLSKQMDQRTASAAPEAEASAVKPAHVTVAPAETKPAPIPPPAPEPVRVAAAPPPKPQPVIAPERIAPAPIAPAPIAPIKPTPTPPVAPHVIPPPLLPQQPRAAARTTAARYAPYQAAPPRKGLAERLRATLPLEEVLGMNLFAKFGIILLVTGFALLGRVALVAMGPSGKVALLYAAAATLLGGGIWLEGKERYRLIGRTGIGGGWALLFFTTYAMHHVTAMQVMTSETLNCVLMLGVAVAMVAHTLRYQSQLVTGLAFLLAFSTIALSQDTVYALTAGAILAIGIVAISLRMGWYELEVFGILATYLNHLYWLYRSYPNGVAGHPFPQFLPSAIILVLYWLTFRISYVARGIRAMRDEHVSTVAALVNTTLLLAVMKFQSTHPELTFYALLALGALEFFFGQLPAARRRRPAFILLTVLGTVLMFAAVPFKFTGNNIAVLWMIAAEVLLVAGIAQAEAVFRRLGLLTGLFTGVLIAYEAKHIIELRLSSEVPLTTDGILLLTCSLCFYLNAHLICRKWSDLFGTIDERLAVAHSYVGGITAFIGAWGIFTHDWTAVAWAVLMLAAAFGAQRLVTVDLFWQSWLLAAATLWRALATNCHFASEAMWTGDVVHHFASRVITLPIIAAAFYLSAYTLLKVGGEPARWLRVLSTWAGTALLFLLAGLELQPQWAVLTWLLLAALLVEAGRHFQSNTLSLQAHALSLFAILGGFDPAFHATYWHGIPMLVLVSGTSTAALYWIAYRIGRPQQPVPLQLRALYTWAASGVFAYLLWRQVPENWLALAWMLFAVALALIGRRISLRSLCHQEHVLALLVAVQLVAVNLGLHSALARYVPFIGSAAALYAISRFCTVRDAGYARFAAWTHTWAATALLAALAWHEAPQPWIAPIWALFALALAIVDGVFEVEELPGQAHTLAALAVLQCATFNIYTVEKWHNLDLRLITVSIVVIALYALARWVRIPQPLRERDFHHAYSWVGSFLAAWTLWSELQPVAVAVGLALFGLVLFEWGGVQRQRQLRLQAYCALTTAFIRIFFVNLTAMPLPGETLSPRIYTVLPLALIYFFVWAQLQSEKGKLEDQPWPVGNILAYFGTGCIAALLYFQMSAEWIIVAWAGVVLALMIAEIALRKRVFLQQAALLTVAIVARGVAHNVLGGSYFTAEGWRGNFSVLSWASVVLFAALPVAFRLRGRYAAQPASSRLGRFFEYPEQLFFFAPIVLITAMLAVKMTPGMITLSLALEGVLVILLGLVLGQRSYRLTGLLLLLVCVGKIVARDAWRLTERDRYITFIVLGGGLTLVSMLYNKYRESVRRLL